MPGAVGSHDPTHATPAEHRRALGVPVTTDITLLVELGPPPSPRMLLFSTLRLDMLTRLS